MLVMWYMGVTYTLRSSTVEASQVQHAHTPYSTVLYTVHTCMHAHAHSHRNAVAEHLFAHY